MGKTSGANPAGIGGGERGGGLLAQSDCAYPCRASTVSIHLSG
ncbi:hypothetical protein [Wielerella bovis]|nr:hypothetical protein [Wielerella bovis]